MVFSVVILSGDESRSYAGLYKKLCNQGNLDPHEFLLLQEILVKTENVEITNVEDLKEYLCENCKECVFPKDGKLIEKIFGLDKKVFHITLKPDILKKLKASSERIQKFLRKTKNPDIGYNPKTGRIGLQNPTNKLESIEINLKLQDILK